MRLKEAPRDDETMDNKRFKGLGGDGDLFGRLGIDIGGDTINIDLGKTKGFFNALQGMLKTKAEKLQEDIASGSVDLGENVGIKVDNKQINIDLGKPKSFSEDLRTRIAGFASEIDQAVKEINKK
jgi:hypothetical protein